MRNKYFYPTTTDSNPPKSSALSPCVASISAADVSANCSPVDSVSTQLTRGAPTPPPPASCAGPDAPDLSPPPGRCFRVYSAPV